MPVGRAYHIRKTSDPPGVVLAPLETRRDHGWARLPVRGGHARGGHERGGRGLERLRRRDETRGISEGRRRGVLLAQGADDHRDILVGVELVHVVGAEANVLNEYRMDASIPTIITNLILLAIDNCAIQLWCHQGVTILHYTTYPAHLS